MKNEEWKNVKLEDLCDELSDGLHKAPVFVENGEYIFVNAKNLAKGYIVDPDKSKHTSYEEYLKYKIDLNERTILYSIDGTIGNIARYRGEKCVLGKGACYINLKKDIFADFIYYQLQSPHFNRYINHLTTGSTIGHISLKTMRNYTFSLPPLAEQQRIAKILSALDDKIELNNAINRNLEEQAQALFKSWFVDFAPFGGEMLEDWTIGKLSDIADITMGQSPDGKSYNENGDGVVFYQGRAEFGWRFPTRRLFTTAPSRMAKKYDTLMSVRAPVGDLNIANEDCCIGRGLAAIHSKDNHQSFVHYTIDALKPKLDMYNGEGTVFGCINRDSLSNMEVIIPCKQNLDKFESLVSALDAEIFNYSEENQRLIILRNDLLRYLLE